MTTPAEQSLYGTGSSERGGTTYLRNPLLDAPPAVVIPPPDPVAALSDQLAEQIEQISADLDAAVKAALDRDPTVQQLTGDLDRATAARDALLAAQQAAAKVLTGQSEPKPKRGPGRRSKHATGTSNG